MVDDQIAHGIAAEGIIAIGRVHGSTAETHVPNNNIVCLEFDRIPGDANTVARSRVTRNGNIRSPDADAVFELNDSRDIEDDDSRTRSFAGLAKTARAAIVEIVHDDHLAAAAAKGVYPSALGARKGGNLRL